MPPQEYCNYIVNDEVKLSKIINMKDPLILLSRSIDWRYFDNELGKTYNSIIGRPGINTIRQPVKYCSYFHYEPCQSCSGKARHKKTKKRTDRSGHYH